MTTIAEFTESLENEKKMVFENFIKEYEENTQGTNWWDGPTLSIEGQRDVFIYLSQDKKTLSISYDSYDSSRSYSYLIYLCHYLQVAKYTNGAIELIGFYDDKYEKVQDIPINSLKIVDCRSGNMSFTYIPYPEFFFGLVHRDGNKHRSIRGAILRVDTCQKALDSIWSIETFYEDLSTRSQNSPEY